MGFRWVGDDPDQIATCPKYQSHPLEIFRDHDGRAVRSATPEVKAPHSATNNPKITEKYINTSGSSEVHSNQINPNLREKWRNRESFIILGDALAHDF